MEGKDACPTLQAIVIDITRQREFASSSSSPG
jgi:hypothetical protein